MDDLTEDLFLREIAAAPADPQPRGVYADWLEEQGDVWADAKSKYLRLHLAGLTRASGLKAAAARRQALENLLFTLDAKWRERAGLRFDIVLAWHGADRVRFQDMLQAACRAAPTQCESLLKHCPATIYRGVLDEDVTSLISSLSTVGVLAADGVEWSLGSDPQSEPAGSLTLSLSACQAAEGLLYPKYGGGAAAWNVKLTSFERLHTTPEAIQDVFAKLPAPLPELGQKLADGLDLPIPLDLVRGASGRELDRLIAAFQHFGPYWRNHWSYRFGEVCELAVSRNFQRLSRNKPEA